MVIYLKWITIGVRKNSKLYCFAHPVLADSLALSSLASVPRVYHGDGEGDGEGRSGSWSQRASLWAVTGTSWSQSTAQTFVIIPLF